MKVDQLVRSNIKNLKPFSSARSEFSGEAEVFLDANESPYNNGINRYPDPYQLELKEMIASRQPCTADNIILGNGSDEIIDLLVRTFCVPGKDRIRYISPSFGMYEVTADINDVGKMQVPLTAQFDLDVELCVKEQTEEDKILFLCSPNNPTGNLLTRSLMIEVIASWKGIVVVDEAYINFSDETSMLALIENHPKLVILQTFSKAFGAAGLRLGIGYASPEIINYLNKIKPPYNVNSLTQERAMSLLENEVKISTQLSKTKKERTRLEDELKNIAGIEHVFPSDANFLLVRCQNYKMLYNHLSKKGIILRDRSKLPNCERCLRMTVGRAEENDLLIQEIKKFYSNHNS